MWHLMKNGQQVFSSEWKSEVLQVLSDYLAGCKEYLYMQPSRPLPSEDEEGLFYLDGGLAVNAETEDKFSLRWYEAAEVLN